MADLKSLWVGDYIQVEVDDVLYPATVVAVTPYRVVATATIDEDGRRRTVSRLLHNDFWEWDHSR